MTATVATSTNSGSANLNSSNSNLSSNNNHGASNSMLVRSNSSNMSSNNNTNELDERLVAKAALDAAEDELQSLCASHAGTFVSVERRGRALEGALTDLTASLAAAVEAAEAAQTALQGGNQEDEDDLSSQQQQNEHADDMQKRPTLAVLSERHRVRRRTLLQHSALLELLELPGLMDACVRSALYEEALQIASFCNTLERRHVHAPGSAQKTDKVILHVVLQIRSRQQDLHTTLLKQLQTAVPLPVCLEVVTALRRLNSIELEGTLQERHHAISEQKLQVDFLEARNVWLDHAAAASEDLLDTIERYRTRVFEVATQFNAIFRASQPQQSGSEHHSNNTSLLSVWMARRIHTFLDVLKSHPMQEAAALRDALEAAVFFAVSLGRLRADFSGHLPALFAGKMFTLVTSTWKEGLTQLEETLRVCVQAGVAGPLAKPATTTTTTSTDASDFSATSSSANSSPPRWLLQVPPLARLVNAVLAGLNQVRRCLLPALVPRLRSYWKNVLCSQVETALQQFDQMVHRPGLRGEAKALREAAATLKLVWKATARPYLAGSLEAALGQEARAVAMYAQVKDPFYVPAIVEEQQPEPVEEEAPTEEQDDQATADPVAEETTEADEELDAPAEEPVVDESKAILETPEAATDDKAD